MKIFIIDTYYSAFLRSFYHQNPEMRNKSYAEQKQALMDVMFGTADFFSRNFMACGHVAEEFIINNEILQKQWADEHGVSFSKNRFCSVPYLKHYFRSNWISKILEAQIKEFSPDLIFSLDIRFTPLKLFTKLKRTGLIIAGQIASPLPPRERFQPYDILISSLPHYVKTFRNWGQKSEYMPLAFEPMVLQRLPRPQERRYDAVHSGGYSQIHIERNNLLEDAALKLRIDFWGYGIENLNPDSPILKTYHGESWGRKRYEIMLNSKIVITKHITSVANGYANNMTLFEATGCGALVFTDWKQNLPQLFNVGSEIETYHSSDELCTKIQYYLKHENERRKLAIAGQKRTIRHHNYKDRIKRMLHLFQKL